MNYPVPDMSDITRYLCIALLASLPVYMPAAEKANDEGTAFEFDPTQQEKWQEQGVKLPPYPDDSDLLVLHVDTEGARFEYAIDEKSLSSDEDGVVRYTIVITSSNHSRNVMYEGIRCSSGEYKTYAFGASDNKMVAARNPQWRFVTRRGSLRYRYDLYNYIFCSKPGTLTHDLRTIKNKIKYSSSENTDF